MQEKSRREFLRTGLSAAIAAAGCCGLGLLEACNLGKKNRQESEDSIRQDAPTPLPKQRPADFEPAYLALHRSGELKKRGQDLWSMLESCCLCPRQCGANRLAGEHGFCQSTSQLVIASFHPHFGEERPLVGRGGSGTVFFANCGLRCVFCINFEINHLGQGEARSIEDLARMMISLQEMGCHNINVVTPTHYSPHILLALDLAASKGLKLPVVYNTCGWERLEILKRLDGIVDIYLPDFKYADGEMAARFSSGARDYPEGTKAAILEMHRQVGTAKPDRDGLIRRGLMIRHLVLPNRVAGTADVVKWIATHLPKDTYVNMMSQYTPVFRAFEFPEISRPITREEYEEAVRWAREAGLTNLDIQGWRG